MKRRRFGLVLVLIACRSSHPLVTHAPAGDGLALDEDGVQMLFPSAAGSSFRLGAGDPNTTSRLVIERNTRATPGIDGRRRFWNLPSYSLEYSSGGSGWTSRLHVHANDGAQRFDWRTQHGHLSSPADLKNQELTVFLRVHRILDPRRATVSLKIRGGAHSASHPDLSSCVMLTLALGTDRAVTRFGKELVHPKYDYVTLTPAWAAAFPEDTWMGLKMVSWNDPHDSARVVNRLYVDTDPFDVADGRPQNGWRLFSEYLDVEGRSTGRYSMLVDWGGWQTTVRTDGYGDVDFALLSVREIVPPQ